MRTGSRVTGGARSSAAEREGRRGGSSYAWAGPAQEKNGRKKRGKRAGRRGEKNRGRGKESGPAVEKNGAGPKVEKRRGGKRIPFLFPNTFSNLIFKLNLNSIQILVKVNHYKNKCAAAWMHQHVTNLIFDFIFTKIISFLYFNAHIIT